MIINYTAIAATLRKQSFNIYILFGQDHFLLNDAALQIKKFCKQEGDWEENIIQVNQSQDWSIIKEEANSYSLFAEFQFLDVRFDKKIDAGAKKFLNEYLRSYNPRSIILLRAPNLSSKDVQALGRHDKLLCIQTAPFSNDTLQKWIAFQLQTTFTSYDKSIPALIQQYTQGNMLACAQTIERIRLSCSAEDPLEVSMVMEQLIDQCEYQLFELSDACLASQSFKAIHLLRRALLQKAEPTLILWILTQEIRKLSSLHQLLQESISFPVACSQLKIWSSRTNLYQQALKRLPVSRLQTLLRACHQTDEQIKTGQVQQVWLKLEQLSLSLSTGNDLVV